MRTIAARNINVEFIVILTWCKQVDLSLCVCVCVCACVCVCVCVYVCISGSM